MKLHESYPILIAGILMAGFTFAVAASAEACQVKVQAIQRGQVIKVVPAAAGLDAQEDGVKPIKEAAEDKKKTDEEAKADEGPVTDTRTLTGKTIELAKNYVKFHMWDGSIVAGELQFDSISIKTEFGVLEVPIEKIRRLHPGLDSFPELNGRIKALVEDLGDKDFDVREKSQRALSGMGAQIRDELETYQDGGNAERKKRLIMIKKEIDESLDEFAEDGESSERSLIRGDSIETPEFSIVGKIQQETFTLKSKFGTLTVQLGDVRMAERKVETVKESIKKTVAIGAEKFFQRQAVSTRIRVNRGDRISIKADGVVQWTNWSSSSTPEGLPNQGVYQSIKSGTLCARIGSTGKVIKVGSKGDWTATKSGVLYLAIAMQDSYLNGSSYKWTGEYNAKVQVKPAKSE
ncbi:MAG: hypothetical protein ACI87E_003941 [Mariniblastus sp.]|jgi:hypothetical protein